MRTFLFILALALVAVAPSHAAGPLKLKPSASGIVRFVCTTGGATAQDVPAGRYKMNVTLDDTYICNQEAAGAVTCASPNGHRTQANEYDVEIKKKTSFSCRHASGAGAVEFSPQYQ